MKREPKSKKRLGFTAPQIIEALFARSVAGAFEHRSRSDVLTIRFPRDASPSMCLGLATRLQNGTARASLDSSMAPLIELMIARYKGEPITDLDLATTDHLLATLY